MFVNYEVLKVLVTPLRDVVNYEAHNSTDSDTYQKLNSAQRKLNSSIEEIQIMVGKHYSIIIIIIIVMSTKLIHFSKTLII